MILIDFVNWSHKVLFLINPSVAFDIVTDIHALSSSAQSLLSFSLLVPVPKTVVTSYLSVLLQSLIHT